MGEKRSRKTAKRSVRAARAREKRQLRKSGVTAKVDACLAACKSADFQRLFAAEAEKEGDAIRDMTAVRRLVLRVLDDMKVPHAGVNLTYSWDPSDRKLGIYFRPHRAAAQVARAALAAVPGSSPA